VALALTGDTTSEVRTPPQLCVCGAHLSLCRVMCLIRIRIRGER
jgi:hypothetical protein